VKFLLGNGAKGVLRFDGTMFLLSCRERHLLHSEVLGSLWHFSWLLNGFFSLFFFAVLGWVLFIARIGVLSAFGAHINNHWAELL